MPAPSLRFGRFELQPRERRLLVDGAPAALGARAFDLLLVMAARSRRPTRHDFRKGPLR